MAVIAFGALTPVAHADNARPTAPLKSYVVEMTGTTSTETVTNGVSRKSAPAEFPNFYFTPQNNSYAGNSNDANFTGQVKYGSDKFTFAWSQKLSARHVAAAKGLMSEVATATKNGKSFGYRDTHSNVPVNYTVHSSFITPTSRYVLKIDETFPITGGYRKVHSEFDFIVTLI
ncbi:hypothetical protein [Streptomyces sp. NPDC048442]|uniref:hypothetical protein n=1 Tax=Streptomyces sp. NPDC048442 TaxID=3154823 RepID=UPI00341F991D